jgi:hypothetical protein
MYFNKMVLYYNRVPNYDETPNYNTPTNSSFSGDRIFTNTRSLDPTSVHRNDEEKLADRIKYLENQLNKYKTSTKEFRFFNRDYNIEEERNLYLLSQIKDYLFYILLLLIAIVFKIYAINLNV